MTSALLRGSAGYVLMNSLSADASSTLVGDDYLDGGAGDDRYGRPPLPNNPQRMRVEPRV